MNGFSSPSDASAPAALQTTPKFDAPIHWSLEEIDQRSSQFRNTQGEQFRVLSSVRSLSTTSGTELAATKVVVIFIHGATYSRATWSAIFANRHKFAELERHCLFLAPDLRLHAAHQQLQNSDLSLATLCNDIEEMYDHLIVNSIKKDNASRLPSVIIVGHSMGGCVAIEISRRGKLPNVRAFVTIDCFADLESQHYYLTNSTDASENRLYESVDHAVDEYRKSFNTVDHNMARISIESRLNQTIHGFKFNLSYLDTSKYWHDWFHDLTQKFLSQSCYKIAIISGSRDDNLSRLDKEMTIAHMSGKYQLNPLPGACHNVQEDQPMEVLDIINTFVRRVLPIWK